jgi:hypothetical protein
MFKKGSSYQKLFVYPERNKNRIYSIYDNLICGKTFCVKIPLWLVKPGVDAE